MTPLSVHPRHAANAETGTTINGPPMDSTQTEAVWDASASADGETLMPSVCPRPLTTQGLVIPNTLRIVEDALNFTGAAACPAFTVGGGARLAGLPQRR
ncbi:hypothetical protein [Streptomyces sp. NBC_00989]|uniref:hypothetical protein n=1 Tax=Streptomyces sp. NBC_00989 TaxID=2903705 RepID=UPI0038635CF5|nr:hypothetical protein OG714_05025 [Streptomyces sp. NBC_00989]